MNNNPCASNSFPSNEPNFVPKKDKRNVGAFCYWLSDMDVLPVLMCFAVQVLWDVCSWQTLPQLAQACQLLGIYDGLIANHLCTSCSPALRNLVISAAWMKLVFVCRVLGPMNLEWRVTRPVCLSHFCVFSRARLHKLGAFIPSATFQYFLSFPPKRAPRGFLPSPIYGFVLFTFLASPPPTSSLCLHCRKPHASEQMISSVYSKSFEACEVLPNIVKRRPSAPVRTCECISVFLWGIRMRFLWMLLTRDLKVNIGKRVYGTCRAHMSLGLCDMAKTIMFQCF